MGQNLYYRPITKAKSFGAKGDTLKIKMRECFPMANGATLLNDNHVDYLRGIRDGGVKDAQLVLDAIDKYGEIEMFLQ